MVFYIEAIGFAAGVLTTIALLPQAVKSWKTKSTKDISLWWIMALNTGVLLWLIYGILIASFPLILANVFTLILALLILFLKIRHG